MITITEEIKEEVEAKSVGMCMTIMYGYEGKSLS